MDGGDTSWSGADLWKEIDFGDSPSGNTGEGKLVTVMGEGGHSGDNA